MAASWKPPGRKPSPARRPEPAAGRVLVLFGFQQVFWYCWYWFELPFAFFGCSTGNQEATLKSTIS